jgi:hypothetical protein
LKELAINNPTLFYRHIDTFFGGSITATARENQLQGIWVAIYDMKSEIRSVKASILSLACIS